MFAFSAGAALSFGGVEICLIGDDAVVTAYEMKMKRVTVEDIEAAVTKIAKTKKRIPQLSIRHHGIIDVAVSEYTTTFYEKLDGTE